MATPNPKNFNLPVHQYEPSYYSGAKVRASEISMEYNAVSASTTLVMNTIGNANCHYFVEVTANSPTITLPTAANAYGMGFFVKNTGSGTAILAAAAGQTIDGTATQSLTQYQGLTVVSNGTNWLIQS
jgi:hypothetical protein